MIGLMAKERLEGNVMNLNILKHWFYVLSGRNKGSEILVALITHGFGTHIFGCLWVLNPRGGSNMYPLEVMGTILPDPP